MSDGLLQGPYRFSREEVEARLTRKSPGTYVLGIAGEREFAVRSVGRSDADLAAELKTRVGEYPAFLYAYTATAESAFRLECELFHGFSGSGLQTRFHPMRRPNSRWQCPRCQVFNY